MTTLYDLRDQYQDEPVTRTAPRWAWDIIDETLAMDAQSKAFDPELREQIAKACKAMIDASEDFDVFPIDTLD